MAAMIDFIYNGLPESLQNLGVTLYGYKQYRLRYGRQLPAPYENVAAHTVLSADELRHRQSQRLQLILNHAEQYVPYYTSLFKQLNITAKELTLENFSTVLPVLEKHQIVAKPTDFHSTADTNNCIALFTSGTSGSPTPIQCTYDARAINYSYYRNMLLERGCDVRDRSATFAGRSLISQKAPTSYWRKDHFNRTLFMSSYHLSETTIPAYIRALESWQPLFIDSYPSAIGELARHIVDRKIKHRIKPKFVLTSSETLSEQQRDHITQAFDCPILDHYGCTEMAVNAYTGQSEGYSISPLYSLVEFEQSKADNYSLICTGLLNMAMPLIRYRIGDEVSGVTTDTSQPFRQQSFQTIVGREDDLVVTPDGRHIGRLDPAFKGLDGIKLAQIIQTSISQLKVLIVPLHDINQEEVTRKLVENLQKRTSKEMDITVVLVDQIPLSKAGKFKSVISQLPKRNNKTPG